MNRPDNIKARNIVWQQSQITKQQRAEVLGHKSKVLWFTGLSGSGKSTVAGELEKKLHEKGIVSYVLDGDNIRHGLNNDLGFSPEARKENIRRVGEVARLFYDAGIFVVVCFISPYKEDRDRIRNFIGDDFVEVFVKCSLEECEKRDKKGLYEKARRGEIKDFTGIHAPYEEPQNPELVINTEENTAKECADKILNLIISPLQE